MADRGVAEELLLFRLALMHSEIAVVLTDSAYASAASVIEPQGHRATRPVVKPDEFQLMTLSGITGA
ncbi:hypothetical protein ACWD7F_28165 [Streptomyces sp. NPDC005122]